MAPSKAISTDQMIDPNMSLDPELPVPIEETVGSVPTQTTHLSSKDVTPSLVLSSANENIDSLMKTEEFLDFIDDLSQEPSSLSDREGTCKNETVPSDKPEKTSHSLDFDSESSQNVSSQLRLKISPMLMCHKVIQLSLQTFLLLKVNLVQPCLIVRKVL